MTDEAGTEHPSDPHDREAWHGEERRKAPTPGIWRNRRGDAVPDVVIRSSTAAEDLNSAAARKVNLIWEVTQAVIAVVVVIFTMAAALYGMQSGRETPNLTAVAFGTVIGFYFSRPSGRRSARATDVVDYRTK